jgi:hypothetical protein
MLNLRKNVLALAVAAAALGGGISSVQAVEQAPDGIGQVLIYPYFTVRDGWRTFIHVTNTSENTVAAKVRFREAANSQDVLDFVLVLSPRDMWTAVVETRGGVAGVRPTDNSCTAPVIGKNVFKPFGSAGFGPPPEGSNFTEGYVEIVTMGVSSEPTNILAPDNIVSYYAKHETSGANAGLPRNCDIVEGQFSADNIGDVEEEFDADMDPVLTGKFDLVNTTAGQAGAARAVPLVEFTADPLLFAQEDPTWNFPNLDSAAVSGTYWGIFAVNEALNATAVLNEWVLNPNLGEKSSWVVTFPTKTLTVAAVNRVNQVPEPDLTLANNFNGCQNVTINLRNREEKSADVGFSGAGGNQLCNEVNVVNFIDSTSGISAAGLLQSSVGKTVDVAPLKSPFLGGWARINMPANSVLLSDSLTAQAGEGHTVNANLGAAPVLAAVNGRPVLGFNITGRTNPEDTVLYDHVYIRPVD